MHSNLRAALTLLPSRRGGELPGDTLAETVLVDRERLAAYDRVCGFRLADTLPLTYPHVLAFPLTMRLITMPGMPFPAVGLVHIANRITQLRPVTAAAPLELTARAEGLRPHGRGRQFDVVTTASVAGEEVWRGVATYLAKEKEKARGERREQGDRPPGPEPSARWRVPARVGADYAAVSGDRNPIHTSLLGARLFGFPRPIAHGMWSKARCLAALAGRLPAACTVDVAFQAPILLPARVSFAAAAHGDRWDFGLYGRRPHLAGQVTPP